MKVEYFSNGELKQQEVNTLEELENMGRTVCDGNIIICMNGYEYTLCEEDNAPIGSSCISVNYSKSDETNYNIDVHNLTQLKEAIETVQQANAKDMLITGALFNDLS